MTAQVVFPEGDHAVMRFMHIIKFRFVKHRSVHPGQAHFHMHTGGHILLIFLRRYVFHRHHAVLCPSHGHQPLRQRNILQVFVQQPAGDPLLPVFVPFCQEQISFLFSHLIGRPGMLHLNGNFTVFAADEAVIIPDNHLHEVFVEINLIIFRRLKKAVPGIIKSFLYLPVFVRAGQIVYAVFSKQININEGQHRIPFPVDQPIAHLLVFLLSHHCKAVFSKRLCQVILRLNHRNPLPVHISPQIVFQNRVQRILPGQRHGRHRNIHKQNRHCFFQHRFFAPFCCFRIYNESAI